MRNETGEAPTGLRHGETDWFVLVHYFSPVLIDIADILVKAGLGTPDAVGQWLTEQFPRAAKISPP